MKSKTLFRIITILLILGIIGAVVGVVWKYTNGFNESFKTFYLMKDGVRILSEQSSDEFKTGTTVRFDVRYTFDTEITESRDYNVKIIPNEAEDFEYTADGVPRAWMKAGDLSEGFALQKEADYFTITLPPADEVQSMEELMKVLLPKAGNTFKLPAAFDETRERFVLRVSSYNDAVSYDIRFSVSFRKTVYVYWGGTATWECDGSELYEPKGRYEFYPYRDDKADWARGDAIGEYRPNEFLDYYNLRLVDGWYTDKECTQRYDFTQPLTGDLYLYAKFEPVSNKYTVEWRSLDNPGEAFVTTSFTYMQPIGEYRPTLDGYTVSGLYRDPDEGSKRFDTWGLFTSDLVVYVKLTPIGG